MGKRFIWAILICLLVLYAIFLSLDIAGLSGGASKVSELAKYISMLLCFALAFIPKAISVKSHTEDDRLLLLAIGFTLIADYFLLFTDRFTLGVAVFCGAHLAHRWRFYGQCPKRLAALTVFILALGAILQMCGIISTPLYIFASWYAILLVSGFIATFYCRYDQTRKRMLQIGMALFILCDIQVAIHHLTANEILIKSSGVFMWFFYLPSQVLLALSGGALNILLGKRRG